MINSKISADQILNYSFKDSRKNQTIFCSPKNWDMGNYDLFKTYFDKKALEAYLENDFAGFSYPLCDYISTLPKRLKSKAYAFIAGYRASQLVQIEYQYLCKEAIDGFSLEAIKIAAVCYYCHHICDYNVSSSFICGFDISHDVTYYLIDDCYEDLYEVQKFNEGILPLVSFVNNHGRTTFSASLHSYIMGLSKENPKG